MFPQSRCKGLTSKRPRALSVTPCSCASLALHVRAALGRSGRAGTGYTRTTTDSAFGHRVNERVLVSGGVRPSVAGPNLLLGTDGQLRVAASRLIQPAEQH